MKKVLYLTNLDLVDDVQYLDGSIFFSNALDFIEAVLPNVIDAIVFLWLTSF